MQSSFAARDGHVVVKGFVKLLEGELAVPNARSTVGRL